MSARSGRFVSVVVRNCRRIGYVACSTSISAKAVASEKQREIQGSFTPFRMTTSGVFVRKMGKHFGWDDDCRYFRSGDGVKASRTR
jgi:hypothetical protein